MTQAQRKFYEKRFTEKSITGDSPEMVWLVENIIRELNISKNDKVLDVGCGDAYVLERVRDRVDVKGYGIDISVKAIRIAKRLTSRYSTDLEFCVGDAKYLPFSDNFFDKVICSEIIEHVPNNAKFLKETRRVLRTGGLIYITFPNEKVSFLFRRYCNFVDKIEGHLRRYELPRFEYLLRELGYKVVKARFTGHLFIWLFRQLITYNVPIKNFFKRRYEEKDKDDKKLGYIRRQSYSRGLLSRLYHNIFMLDLKVNRKNCLKCNIIIQKSDAVLQKVK